MAESKPKPPQQKSESQKGLVLCYWLARGRPEAIKLVLEYFGLPYEMKYYKSYEEWFTDKAKLPTNFPNLPLLYDGDLLLSESDAIFHHICYKARGSDLLGRDPEQIVLVRTMNGFYGDLHSDIMGYQYAGACTLQELISNKIIPKYERLSMALGKQPWLCGEDLTYPDFEIAELMQKINRLDWTIIGRFPNLVEFSNRFESLPAIARYRASKRAAEIDFTMAQSEKDKAKKILASEEEFNKLSRAIFEATDADGSGFISASELNVMLRNLSQKSGISAPGKGQVKRLMKQLDTNHDGKLSPKEFSAFVKAMLENFASS